MRIDFSVDGGLAAFPGLAKPVSIDCEALPPGRSAYLRELMRRADFFALPTTPPPTTGPDARRYTIAVDDGGQCSTVTVAEPIDNAAMRDLVSALRDHARAARRGR
jgi:emfourin